MSDPFTCPGCHVGDFADFDHYCDALGITDEETPVAFAAWLSNLTGTHVEMSKVCVR